MLVVVHRKAMEDADRDYKIMCDNLGDILGDTIGDLKCNKRNRIIDLGDNCRVIFMSGEVWRMAGMRPDIYNVDTIAASEFLAISTSCIGGKEISNINKLYEFLRDIYLVNKKGE